MPGLLRGVVRTAAVVGTASAVHGRVQRRQQGRWAQQDEQQYEQQQYEQQQQQQYQQQQAAPPPQASGMDDKLAQLEQLGQLREQGVLSDAEFETQKGRILAS